MTGDKQKPESRMSRFVECFADGAERTTRKGKARIPSTSKDKRYNRRWRRRRDKKEIGP